LIYHDDKEPGALPALCFFASLAHKLAECEGKRIKADRWIPSGTRERMIDFNRFFSYNIKNVTKQIQACKPSEIVYGIFGVFYETLFYGKSDNSK
jgi:hypothetical protein